MTLQLKRGPKDRIWAPVTARHWDDDGKTYTDEFDVRIRLANDIDAAVAEARKIMGLQEVEGDDAKDAVSAKEALSQYLRDNIDGFRNLIDADDNEVPWTTENFESLIRMPPYRNALVQKVIETRVPPRDESGNKALRGAERKN